MTRRELLTIVKQAGTVVVTAAQAMGSTVFSRPKSHDDRISMLYDTTLCTGCKACVSACSTANGLVPDTAIANGLWQMPLDLNSKTKNIIKLFVDTPAEEQSFIKRQCMHCIDPACVSGCPFYALHVNKWGAVTWEPSLCIGCRYCEVACPFLIPKFEWDRFNPKIVKCEFCFHLLEQGKEQPACTGVCPTGAVVFGTRNSLLSEAKSRIAAKPGKYYQNRVYGEHEAGGTAVLYLSHLDFQKLGLPKLSKDSLVEYATRVHSVLYKMLWLPLALYFVIARQINKNWAHHKKEMEATREKTGLEAQL